MANYKLYELVEATEAITAHDIEVKQLGFIVDIHRVENTDTLYTVEFIIIAEEDDWRNHRKPVVVTDNQIKHAKADK